MDPNASAEYLSLRRTVALRGTVRPILVAFGITVWAAILIVVLAFLHYPVACAIPLLVVVGALGAVSGSASAGVTLLLLACPVLAGISGSAPNH